MTLRLLVLAVTLGCGAAAACDKVTRTTTFLGWTADAQLFAWRVHETCEGCKPRWVNERTFVRSIGGGLAEYLTRFEHVEGERPKLPDGKAFEAWLAKNPLLTAAPAQEQAKLSLQQDGVAVKPGPGGERCAKREGDVQLVSSRATRRWYASSAVCGCARGFVSPDGAFVAWLTGPAKRTCEECSGPVCCGDVEVLVVPQER